MQLNIGFYALLLLIKNKKMNFLIGQIGVSRCQPKEAKFQPALEIEWYPLEKKLNY